MDFYVAIKTNKMKYITRIKFLPLYAFSFAPMFALYMLSNLAFIIVYHVIKYRRRVVLNNLENSFSDKSNQELEIIERAFYRHLCDIIFESIKALTVGKKAIKKRFCIKNPELIQEYYEEKRSIIMYTAHHGNWEWMSFLPLYIAHQVTTFYQPLSNKYFNELIKINRERFGAICIESNKGYKSLLNFSQRNILTLNCIIGDQSPRKDSTKHWVQFLNQETAFLVGTDRIAKKSNQVVVFPSFRKRRRGYYELEFKVIEEDVAKKNSYEIIDKYTELLEETIINSPELWLWSHRRWKLTM